MVLSRVANMDEIQQLNFQLIFLHAIPQRKIFCKRLCDCLLARLMLSLDRLISVALKARDTLHSQDGFMGSIKPEWRIMNRPV